ncbi:hypothetical protein PSN45_002507 [Yamadazyma tenuis]|uniref:Ribosomal protein S2 n=1 Tax=Candida tenuis (strain ATCC 10573 / BCRC 21748 / CBS 615 / JCM 9827 / NBRC 10315 / NRRL Y-1498 / VKM Y-70) TaxID=590646 RepID=G3B082_CANTC|nr:uncharacterized protein CANTEDRAFT_113059 [Yamadazyma tenuis ATCC 10573]XP_006685196.1 uncharacterized protein CANTEDRAFT_113059 [Yamadazyma tenuis ATCC 10573]EGV65509.1 hypothetical protein CANTEDRAFT_113059 [Yamadazyma tenuis ATCC 10573]EGV65510.1 hypothetical protein CANTEDRAFT_113059 [Yamadazyma tenuis ATCC 10573]WEJ95001.1 hypothetical protein PSN45_002507 [Yamadazyma tenuis]
MAIAVRPYSASTGTSSESGAETTELSQRQLRERALAEALARDEEAQAKAKLLVDMKYQSKDLIARLNKTPAHLIKDRVSKLQSDLTSIDAEKVEMLDKQLEEFMLENLKLPAEEITNRPWADLSTDRKFIDPSNNKSDSGTNTFKSTASNSILNQYPYLKPTPDHHEYSTQELYLRYLNHSRHSGNLGSKLTDVYQPKNEVNRPKSISDMTISTLMAAGCHLGHSKAMWRPSTQPFIYGEYDGIHLIDLNHTLVALKRAVKVVKGVANKGGMILYVGTTKNWEQQRALEAAATRSNGYYISRKWIPGTITNFTQVTKHQGESRLVIDMMDQPSTGSLDGSSPDDLIKPDLIVIMNPVENRNCINECIKSRIPTIGLCDTNMEPSLLTYPIPSNDDSMRVSSMMLGVLSRAAQEGIQERRESVHQYRSQKNSAQST